MQISRLLTNTFSINFCESAVRVEWKDTPWKPCARLQSELLTHTKQYSNMDWDLPNPPHFWEGLVSTTMHVICSFLTIMQQSMHLLASICHFFSPQNHPWLLTGQWKTFTEKYSKHVLLINNHHHNDRQHISLCILFGWTPCMRTTKLAGLSSPRRWMLQKESTTSLVHKTNEKTSKSPLFQTEVISQLVELAWSIYTQSYPSGHPGKTA